MVNIEPAIEAGQIKFVFDSFDEAEILSGATGVENFVTEIYDYVKNAGRPCIVFLARSETAKKIAGLLDQLSEHKSSYILLEIDYFDETSGFELGYKFMGNLLTNDHDAKYLLKSDAFNQHPKVVEEIFNNIINSIKQTLAGHHDEGIEKEIKRFIGYAPVIQAIGLYIISISDSLNELKNKTHFNELSGSEVICKLMSELLLREQHKIVHAAKIRAREVTKEQINWSSLYSPTEQLVRIFLYHEDDNSAYKVEHAITSIPAPFVNIYEEILESFLPQHPFLNNREFAGPAFRDYLFANLLNDELLSLFIEDKMKRKEYGLTSVFYKFYFDVASNVSGKHVGYIYESITALENLNDIFELFIRKGDHSSEHIWELGISDFNRKDNVHVIVDDDNPVIIYQRLNHARIHLNGKLILSGENFELSDVEIDCESIQFDTANVFLRLSRNEEINIKGNNCFYNPSMKVKAINQGSSFFDWPGSDRYPWSAYNSEFHNKGEGVISIEDAFLALRGVLKWFRRDRREDYARYFELINNVAIGRNKTRRKMLDFLIEKGLITLKGNLYFYNPENEKDSGLSFGALNEIKMLSTIQPFLQQFIEKNNT